MSREKAIKNYVDGARALQEKYAEIRHGMITQANIIEQKLKPLIKPLQNIETQLKKPLLVQPNEIFPQYSQKEENKDREEEEDLSNIPENLPLKVLGPLATKYLGNYASKNVKTDSTFGITMGKDGNLYIGNSPIVVENDDIIFQNGVKIKGSDGLWQLLTLAEPERKHITEDDLNEYENIILSTYTYRQNNDPNDHRIKSSGGAKYKTIIRPILINNNLLGKQPITPKQLSTPINTPSKRPLSLADELGATSNTEQETIGYGLGLRKLFTNSPIEYVYWNTLDELLERLYIVYGEIKSGNKNPNLVNEIINILQEIREI